MSNLWFSRVRLKPDTRVKAIAELLLPDAVAPDKQGPETLAVRHKLIWTLFSDGPERKRDFLWREFRAGEFYVLSHRQPQAGDLFDVDCKMFEPKLRSGDQLWFSLRANPVISSKAIPGSRGKRHDVVMNKLRTYRNADPTMGDNGERRFERDRLTDEAGREWIEGQASRNGFRLLDVTCDSYRQHVIHPGARQPGNLSTLDLAGRLEVSAPATFLERLSSGFGPAKAFGCGLMLIRRTWFGEGPQHDQQ